MDKEKKVRPALHEVPLSTILLPMTVNIVITPGQLG